MRVTTVPSFLQVTVVAGPPVEVQVRVLDWLSYLRLATRGKPENVDKLIMVVTAKYAVYRVKSSAVY